MSDERSEKRRWWTAWSNAVSFASGEFILKRHPNGGDVILARTILTGVLIYAAALVVRGLLVPPAGSLAGLRHAIVDTLPWFGAIFAGVYAAFYTRFSSQWTYLAGLYNEIKAVEAQVADSDKGKAVIAQWKAGFIEDAHALHLAEKPGVQPIIAEWVKNAEVRAALLAHPPHNAEWVEPLLLRHPVRAA